MSAGGGSSVQWQPIESMPQEGCFLVYMPKEISKVQAARRNANGIFIIGNVFAFDTSMPSHWMPEPGAP
jgi:hypothetical protein